MRGINDRLHRDRVFAVSGARPSVTADIRSRQRRYALSMSIRTACVIGAVVTGGVLRWALFVGALVLPYIAVVVANVGRAPERGGPAPVALPSRSQLPRRGSGDHDTR